MEPGDLQPLTVYNEHAPCAHGHRNPQQSFGVSKEVMRRGQETQVVMLGGTLGFSHHAVVPPHFAGSSSVASLPCGHTTEGWRNGEKKRGKQGWKDGEVGEVIVADLGWTEDVFLLFSASHENILTK